jgi:hypothetical protein
MSDTPTITAWKRQQDLVDEREFTPWAEEGWDAWNGQSPEFQTCGFACALVGMMRPDLVIETGVGQGYMTRYLTEMLGEGQHLLAFESNDQWRTNMWSLPFWSDNRFIVRLSEVPSPEWWMMAEADLCVLDSDFEYRFQEVEMWHQNAKPGAVALIHDTSDHPDTVHNSLREFILQMGMTGTFLKNPRGCFMAVQGRRHDGLPPGSPDPSST